MGKRAIRTDRAARAVGPYSQGTSIPAGRILFTAGQVGLSAETGEFVSEDTVGQFDQAMRNVTAILEADGATLEDVVKVTVFFLDLGEFAAVNERYATYFSEPYPARSAIQAAALPKGARIEVEAIAVVHD